jgi:hypothetical protein
MVRWVMTHSGGYIANEKQANYVLLGFVIAAAIVSLFFFFGVGHSGGSNWTNPHPNAESSSLLWLA